VNKKWNIIEPDVSIVNRLAEELRINKIICQILANRGIKSSLQAKRFLEAGLDDLEEPFLIKDMQRAVDRIIQAVSLKEKILIFSDYDVDGITSCAILEAQLQMMKADFFHYIPHRIKEGYGLNINVVNLAVKRKVRLLICLDCGICSFNEIEKLNGYGIQTIIIDHHTPKEGRLPNAYAIVNPKQKDCPFSFKELAAVGIVYKLVYCLAKEHKNHYLQLATLGTVADVVPLLGENRIIVKNGLKHLNQNPSLGIRALIKESGLGNKEINPARISFILAPRINASGRIDSAELSLGLLTSQSEQEAVEIAKNLNQHNRERQRIGDDILKEAISLVERNINFKDHYVIVLFKEDWHVGVLGIVAAKIAERYFRPTIIISLKDGIGKGSGRSIQGFHLYNALSECAEYISEFGGHSQAVGLNIPKENIDNFIQSLNKVAREKIVVDELLPSLNIDAQLPLGLINSHLIRQCQLLGPFGIGNPRPLFCTHNLFVKSPPQILGKDTIKFWVSDGEYTFEAIGFGFKEMAAYLKPKQKVDLAYNLLEDNMASLNPVILEIKDIRFD